MDPYPLISVLILNYENENYIINTLKSIFSQSYPRIELIISDDGSKNFPLQQVIDFINENKTDNIERVRININPVNKGTVINMETALKLSKGDYITVIAADDVFYSDHVFEIYMKEYETLPDDAEYLTGQIEMWNNTLTKKISNFITEEDMELVRNSTPQELFNALSVKCILPAQGFWKRDYFDKIGSMSEHYRVIEDYSRALRTSRLGIKVYILDYPIIKHRDGGISHGNKTYGRYFHIMFVQDEINYYIYEIQPYQSLLSEENADSAFTTYLGRVDFLNKLKTINSNEIIVNESYLKSLALKTITRGQSILTNLKLISVFAVVSLMMITIGAITNNSILVFITIILFGCMFSLLVYKLIPHGVIIEELKNSLLIIAIVIIITEMTVYNNYLVTLELSFGLGYLGLLGCAIIRRLLHG